MFTTHLRRSETVGKSRSASTRVAASLGVIAITTGFALAAAPAASAAPAPASWAQAQFLSGSILGIDLDEIVELKPAEASNDGTQAKQTQNDNLQAEVLGTVEVDQPSGIQFSLGDILEAGVAHQYAEAEKSGASLAATGAIGDDGGAGVGQPVVGPAGSLDLDLDSLLQSDLSSVLTDLRLQVDGVSAQAAANLGAASGSYTIADARLSITSPAVGQLSEKVAAALARLDDRLVQLGSDDGALGDSVDRILDPVLGPLGTSATVSVTIDADLQTAVNEILTSKYGNGAVSFDLQSGAILVDLEKLLGGDINALEPGTEILSGEVIDTVLRGITDTVATLADQIVDRVRAALHDATVTVHADLDLLSSQQGGTSTVCLPVVDDLVGGGIGDLLDLGGHGGLGGLGGLLGRSLPTDGSLCEIVHEILPDLRSTVNVDIVGTVDDLMAGTAATADVSASLLGGTVPVALDATAIIGSVGSGLGSGLFGDGGGVQELVDDLNTGLVTPAVTGLLGDGDSVSGILDDLVSVKANVQELTPMNGGTTFTQTALRVTVLPAAGSGSAAQVNLAQAAVGPNASVVVPPDCTGTGCTPCTTNCSPTTPACVTGCGSGSVTTSGLAYTGMGIATLIAIILALLAAGAYLAREGYRRTHTKSLSSD